MILLLVFAKTRFKTADGKIFQMTILTCQPAVQKGNDDGLMENKRKMIVIERCEKKAGVFVGAKTYRLVLSDDGLYILDLGKAMGVRNERNLIADKILDKIQENREKERQEKEKELSTVDLKSLLKDKKNKFLKKTDVKEVRFSNSNQYPKLVIKSSVINVTLHFWPIDTEKVEQIAGYLKN